MNINKILVLSFLGMMISSQTYARDEITCPTGTAAGSTCWKCGDNCTATLTGTKMTISGTGDMDDYSYKSASGTPSWGPDAPWSDHRLEITSIKINDGITKVGSYAFSLSYNVTNLDLGNTVESVGKSSLHSLAIDELHIPASMKEIGDFAFSSGWNRSEGFSSIVFEEGSQLERLGEAAFTSNPNLISVELPDSVKYIGEYTFGEDTNLQHVKLPNNPNLIMGDQIFAHTYMTNIALPEEFASSEDSFRNMQASVKVYCTQAVIDSGKCNSSYLYKSPLNVTHYERDGDHFNVYDSNGEIVAQYGSLIDFGTTNYYVPKAAKEAKRIYTVEEATETAKGNKNTFSIRYR